MKILKNSHIIKLSYYFIISTIYAILFVKCVPLTPSPQDQSSNFVPKKISLTNKTYDQSVGGIVIYNQNQITPPILPLNSAESITLEFDIFGNESEYINAKIIHCDASWNKTNIADLQFVDNFNEFLINEFEFSANTSVAYTHYTMNIPKTKISGNYVIAVYRNNEPRDLLFTRRFMITETIVSIETDFEVPRIVDRRRTGQEVNVLLSYENLAMNNPMQEILMTIRQNNRWDNAKLNLQPTNDLSNERVLEFIPFNGETTFDGGNEFRFIDLRTISLPGFNIASIENQNGKFIANSHPFKTIKSNVYTTPVNQDMNGAFFHTTVEPGTFSLNTDYVHTTINLDMSGSVNYPIYILGSFNDWQKNSSNLMIYNNETNTYQFSKFLKQGIYNFTFQSTEKNNKHTIDKSFHLTGNTYDVIVYHKDIRLNYDRIVGYTSILSSVD